MKWIFLAPFVFFYACKPTIVEQKLAGTDSVMVQFFNEEGLIYNAVTSTEKPAIDKLVSYMDNRSITPVKCGSNGKVLFFSKNQLLLEATYHSRETNCRYFSYTLDGKLMHIAMSNEAADFLQSLREDPLTP